VDRCEAPRREDALERAGRFGAPHFLGWSKPDSEARVQRLGLELRVAALERSGDPGVHLPAAPVHEWPRGLGRMREPPDAGVTKEIAGASRSPSRVEVGGRGRHREAHRGQPDGDERAVAQGADLDREIVPARQQIVTLVDDGHLKLEARRGLQEAHDLRPHAQPDEGRAHREPDASLERMRDRHGLLGLLRGLDEPRGLCVEAFALLGEAERPRRAMRESYAQAPLEGSEALADAILVVREGACGGADPARRDHLTEESDVVERVDGHGSIVT